MWEKEDLPPLIHIIQSYDTAFSKKEKADFSAISTWGIFKTGFNQEQIILLELISIDNASFVGRLLYLSTNL